MGLIVVSQDIHFVDKSESYIEYNNTEYKVTVFKTKNTIDQYFLICLSSINFVNPIHFGVKLNSDQYTEWCLGITLNSIITDFIYVKIKEYDAVHYVTVSELGNIYNLNDKYIEKLKTGIRIR